MARLIKAMDWSQTPLGPIESWPQSLRTSVSLTQASSSPIALIWGPGYVQIYNDGYWPICGAKHPVAMGQDFRECWASAFPVIGDAFASACSGKSAYLENMRMFLDRHGFLEETWFTFSFSPITDETGKVGGLFHPVTEVSAQMLSERRTKTLRDVATRISKAKTTEETFLLASTVLAESGFDLPFVLFYLLESDATARLVGQTGIAPDTPASPLLIDISDDGNQPWPINQVAISGKTQQINDITPHMRGIGTGPYPEPPKMALALPITQPGSDKPAAIMIAGTSSRLLMTEQYRGFYDLLAATISNALANARAYEDELKRIATMARAREEQANRLLKTNQELEAFNYSVSHDLKAPLRSINGFVEILQEEYAHLLDENGLGYLQRIRTASTKIGNIIEDLLQLSRVSYAELFRRHINLSELAKESMHDIQQREPERTIDFVVQNDIHANVDRRLMRIAFDNLLGNAWKYTSRVAQPRVEFGAFEQEGKIIYYVRDNGAGFNMKYADRLFKPFVRLHNESDFPGSGIGLATVQRIMNRHKGHAWAKGEKDQGASIYFAFSPDDADGME